MPHSASKNLYLDRCKPNANFPPSAGMDLYFKRHDGQAVTCDDFLAAMADANGADLSGLAGWYSQVGAGRQPTEQGSCCAILCSQCILYIYDLLGLA